MYDSCFPIGNGQLSAHNSLPEGCCQTSHSYRAPELQLERLNQTPLMGRVLACLLVCDFVPTLVLSFIALCLLSPPLSSAPAVYMSHSKGPLLQEPCNINANKERQP